MEKKSLFATEAGICDWVKNISIINLTYNRSRVCTPNYPKGCDLFSTKSTFSTHQGSFLFN
ncbi:MAG: hypothetical protein JWP78_4038 [Mucilaginibacter sp.]|nr:hypothetical protein [Mucilaginibacter sp.]